LLIHNCHSSSRFKSCNCSSWLAWQRSAQFNTQPRPSPVRCVNFVLQN